MKQNICVMDVYDDTENILSSQVTINNNIGFEIPKNYFFIKEKTDSELMNFVLSDGYNQININILDSNKKYDDIYNEINKHYKITESFINYRGQKIIEFFANSICCLLIFDKEKIMKLECNCKKYSSIYYQVYFIAFSFKNLINDNLNEYYYQKNNYIILKNGKCLYEEYDIDILKKNPYEELEMVNNIEFINYITNNKDINRGIKNYYLKSYCLFYEVKSKIDNYLKNNNVFEDCNEIDLLDYE